MITPLLTKKTLSKIKKIFPITLNDKIFLPIVENPKNLENFLKLFPNRIVVSVPNFRIYSNILNNQFIAKEIIKNKIEINMDFFGISNKISFKSITKIVIFFPNNLSLSLVNYALYQLFDLLNQPTPLLIVVNNKKQYNIVLNWVEESKLNHLETKSQNKYFFIIHKFNPSIISNTDFEDYTFKINYKKNFGEFEFLSSDGVFSKDKIDDGTDFLINTILDNKDLITKDAEVIDYFSGMGVIGIILSKKREFKKIHFIESDLISLFLLKKNLNLYQIANSVVHEMDGLKKSTIPSKSIDLIVANPPTHIKKEEFKTFLQISKYLLNNRGKLMIVINKIIPYERTLRDFFPNPSSLVVSEKNKYKIISN